MPELSTPPSPEYRRAVKDAVLYYGALWKANIWNELEQGPVHDPDAVSIVVSAPAACLDPGDLVLNPDGVIAAKIGGLTESPLRIQLLFGADPKHIDGIFSDVGARYPDKLTAGGRIRNQFSSFWKHFLRIIEESLRSTRDEVDQTERSLVGLHRKHVSLSRLYSDLVRPRNDDEARQEIDLILALGTPCFSDRTGKLEVITRPIVLRDEKGGEEHEMGAYRVEIDIREATVRIFSHKTKWESDDYYHPHVGHGGEPCFGNVGERIRSCLTLGRVGQACVLIKEFLESYNEGSAYRSLDKENSRREDYDDCYERHDPRDCVECSDGDCPYNDDAQFRCYEAQNDPLDCVRCNNSNCDYPARAANECRTKIRHGDDPWRCAATCHLDDCRWHGTTDHCMNAENCGNCPNGDNCEDAVTKEEDDEQDPPPNPLPAPGEGSCEKGRCEGCPVEVCPVKVCERRVT